MKGLAFVYGLALGAAQFFVLREIVRLGLSQQARPRRRVLVWVGVKLAIYLAAALAAIYLFENVLLWAGIGLGAGLTGLAVGWFLYTLRREDAREKAAVPHSGKEKQ